MHYKTILAVAGVNSPDGFIKAAAEACRDTGAHISVLVVSLAAAPPIGDYAAVISDAWMEERQEDNRKLAAKMSAIRESLSGFTGSFSVDGLYAEATWADAEIGARAMYADLVLVGDAEITGTDLRRRAIDGALFEARRPVVLAPHDIASALQPKTILLAWDASPDAAAAAREALGLMAAADSVHVVMVDPPADEEKQYREPGADLAVYLARHGVHVVGDMISSNGAPLADVLLAHAGEVSADMIVMGAYGHSRLKERIFGGVTQSVIDSPTIAVLMAR